MIRIHVPILGRRPGETVSEGEKDYDVFADWAEKKDRRGGMIVCEICEEEAAAPEGDKSDGEVEGSKDDGESVQGAEDGDVKSEDAASDPDVEGADAVGTDAGDALIDNTPPVADKPKGNKGDQKKPKK